MNSVPTGRPLAEKLLLLWVAAALGTFVPVALAGSPFHVLPVLAIAICIGMAGTVALLSRR